MSGRSASDPVVTDTAWRAVSTVVEPSVAPLATPPPGAQPTAAGAPARVRVLAPVSGQVWPLERVPDPVFAQKMVGDGLSIDPSDAVLVAACDGEVVSVHVIARPHTNVDTTLPLGRADAAKKARGRDAE